MSCTVRCCEDTSVGHCSAIVSLYITREENADSVSGSLIPTTTKPKHIEIWCQRNLTGQTILLIIQNNVVSPLVESHTKAIGVYSIDILIVIRIPLTHIVVVEYYILGIKDSTLKISSSLQDRELKILINWNITQNTSIGFNYTELIWCQLILLDFNIKVFSSISEEALCELTLTQRLPRSGASDIQSYA